MASAPLSSWNDGPAKAAILDFVAAVTDEAGEGFVPAAERIATLDNDGTLWCERPAYVQAMFILARLHEQAEADRALAERPVVKALLPAISVPRTPRAPKSWSTSCCPPTPT